MRRGHASIGGWRNENSRHFKPRNAGPPQFRPNRNFHLQDSLRFPPPLLFREPPFGNRPALLNTPPPDHRDRNKYRHDNRQNNQYRSHFQEQRSVFPIRDHNRHESMEKIGQPITIYNDNNRYYDYSRDVQFGNMEGKDQRKSTTFPKHQEPHNHHSVSHWTYTPDDKKNYENRNSYRHNKYHDTTDNNKISTAEYSGHRPPSSDHYGSNPSSTLDNSSFSRSVDDTVDIIRKRLQNRNEPLQAQEELRDNSNEVDDNMSRPSSSNYQNIQQIQPVKKRIQRQSLNMEANCDKMKNKIVHQLFKMDKDKIHKLMDNPSSSTKFEYALSSLITESQNSLNRHLRSVAEKSLCSSEAFVHNDNNTIYEDTFMKQMQGILDPQDTVLLEDIKPLVLAELSKVLQLDDYDQPFQLQEDQGNYQALNNQQNYDNYDYDNYPQSEYYEQIHSPQTTYEENYENTHIDNIRHEYTPEPEEQKYLFERRPAKINIEHSVERRMSSELRRQLRNSVDTTMSKEDSFCIERRNSRRSTDTKSNDETERSQPLFDTKAEMLSEEEDPFAELDRQYHVAVDPNFIDTYGISSPQQSTFAVAKLPNTRKEINDINLTKEVHDIKKDIDTQLSNIAKSSLKLVATNSSKLDAEKCISSTVSNSATQIELYQETVNVTSAHKHILDTNYQSTVESRIEDDVTYKSEVTPSKTELLSNSRKRSTDQKPSHRKEKRKKSNSLSSDPVKQTLMHDYTSKDKRFDHKETSKEAKSVETADKSYSDKYVKRKETPKKNEREGQKKRQRSVSSSHSIVSPKENSNNNNKVECKKKLKSIDMFIEHPKKVNVHQAHRNTSLPSATAVKVVDTVKAPIIFNRKVTKKHVSIQVTRKLSTRETQTLESKSVSTRFCQTEKRKILSKCTQTDPVTFEKNTVKATDAFERMKQIDMEIQVLLQEKFKLYNSLESNEPYPSTIQSLGMTVLNVASPELKHDEENDIDTLTEDAIVDDFTSIPVEELEQIALESVGNHKSDKKQERKSRRQKILDEQRASSLSPTTRRNAKKIKTPNISLIEQIITDDRPLEDIISLDDLETVSVKTKRQKTRKLQNIPKKKVTKKAKAVKSVFSLDDFTLKECCVVLNRSDVTKYLKRVSEEPVLEPEAQVLYEIDESTHETTGVVEDATGNDLQFDMLDVSEDIVIGDNCEVKSGDDKYVERNELANTEEVILDNSQCLDTQQSNINQGENICKMYDYSADENLRRDSITVSGHADAVLAIESIENNFIAACLDGNVYYFNFDGQLLATLRGSNLAVTCLTIVKEKYGTTVYTGSLDSRIRYYDLETGLEKGPECNVLSPIQTMDRAWDTIFVGTRTGFVLQFECKNNMLIPVSTVKFSDQSILALRAMKEGPRKVLLVAARSEDVTIRDAQTGLLLRTLQGPKMTVYTLLYEDGKIYCGTSSHQIHVYDYTSGSHSGVHEGGKGAVCLRATGGLLFAGCYDGCVYVYREGEPQPLAQLRGPSLMLLSLAVVGSKIIAGYKDRSLYIWKIPLSILQEMIL